MEVNENDKSNLMKNKSWKNKDSQYLFELQKFLDLVDNVDNIDLRKNIINQMLKCDKCVTNLAEKMFKQILEK